MKDPASKPFVLSETALGFPTFHVWNKQYVVKVSVLSGGMGLAHCVFGNPWICWQMAETIGSRRLSVQV